MERQNTLRYWVITVEQILAFQRNQKLVVDLVSSHGSQLRHFLLARVRNMSDVSDIIQEAEQFFQVLETEVKPRVAGLIPVDPSQSRFQ